MLVMECVSTFFSFVALALNHSPHGAWHFINSNKKKKQADSLFFTLFVSSFLPLPQHSELNELEVEAA